MRSEYDIVVVGAGLVGASFASALSRFNLSVLVIERHARSHPKKPSFDDRSIALAYGSRMIIENLGLWSLIESHAEPIEQIKISQQHHFGVTRLSAEQEGVAALGYVIENRHMAEGLYHDIQKSKCVDFASPADLLGFEADETGVTVSFSKQDKAHSVRAGLLVAADGAHSQVRQRLNIPVKAIDYGQSGVVCNIQTEYSHHHVAFERFTPNGPVAFLPLPEFKKQPRCAVVWTMPHEHAQSLLEMPEDLFLDRLQSVFGYSLGRLVKTGSRSAFPLSLVQAQQAVAPRVALLGNAIHTLHPVAGQGFNLGLRDVSVLLELILQARREQQDFGSHALLQEYERQRRTDHKQVITLTDFLARVFTLKLPPIGALRSFGLLGLDRVPLVKSALARRLMGLTGRMQRFE
jgi:2-octaprenyl-6-methoxyphenol hydroxylase